MHRTTVSLATAALGCWLTVACPAQADRQSALKSPTAAKQDSAFLIAPESLVLGKPLNLAIGCGDFGGVVRIHAFRGAIASTNANGKHTEHRVVLHAWADYVCKRDKRVNLQETAPIRGTFKIAGTKGLLWSGWPEGDARLPPSSAISGDVAPADDHTLTVALEKSGRRVVAMKSVQLMDYSPTIDTLDLTVEKDGVSGVFATSKGTTHAPVVILLHGSEGGSMSAARRWAGSMAEQGFAALALNYVAYSWSPLPGVSDAMANIPVETLAKAEQWLYSRAPIHVEAVGVLGVSKGAELALVAAARYPWIAAVVGCAPSSVVWAGYGRDPKPGEELSSWSFEDRPLPFIPYDHYEDVFAGKATSAEVHSRSLGEASQAQRDAARIHVEDIAGSILLLGSGRDQVWPSSAMVETMREKLSEVGHRAQVQAKVFPEASHFICGTGTDPVRVNGVDGAPDALAAGQAFQMTVDFLHTHLNRSER